MIHIDALQSLVPNPIFIWEGVHWEGLIWLDSRTCPTKEEWENEKIKIINNLPLKKCKEKAKQLLIESDWSEIPSVLEQLDNFLEWKDYRMTVRSFIINPVNEPVFPNKPEVIWK